nr:MAG TPA: hypothetical protein [Crassvirales sp.]
MIGKIPFKKYSLRIANRQATISSWSYSIFMDRF